MDAGNSEGPTGLMDVTTTAGHSRSLAAVSGLFSDFLSRPLGLARIWSEELDRALAATQRYEKLRIGRGTDLSLRDRASKARQLFDQMYASK